MNPADFAPIDPNIHEYTHTIAAGPHAGVTLSRGDWFRLTRHPGAVFEFRHASLTPAGNAWVSAYGGDKDPKGNRAWRSFHLDAEFIPAPAPRAGRHA